MNPKHPNLAFVPVRLEDEPLVEELSVLASAITRVYYDPIIGKAQNDYHLEKFQSVPAISEQLRGGYHYYLVRLENRDIGFLAYYPRGDALYLSKFYMEEHSRGHGYGRQMLSFLIEKAKKEGLRAIELNVNRFNPTVAIYEHLGFQRIREEQIDIGRGFIMDDYVYRLDV